MAAPKRKKRKAATTVGGREAQMVSLAIDLAEKQLAEGTASAQVITHYLKLGSSREMLEQRRLAYETDLLEARANALSAEGRMETLMADAIAAFRGYSGQGQVDSGYDDKEEDYYE